MPTVTWEDLKDLGFRWQTGEASWEKVSGYYILTVDLTHTGPHVRAANPDDHYGVTFHGVRTRADLESLIRLLGEPA